MREQKKRKAFQNQQSGRKTQGKTVMLPKDSKLNKRLINELDYFVEATPATRLSKNLRDLFLLYLGLEKDGFPIQFNEFVTDFYFLMQLLDAIGEEVPE